MCITAAECCLFGSPKRAAHGGKILRTLGVGRRVMLGDLCLSTKLFVILYRICCLCICLLVKGSNFMSCLNPVTDVMTWKYVNSFARQIKILPPSTKLEA